MALFKRAARSLSKVFADEVIDNHYYLVGIFGELKTLHKLRFLLPNHQLLALLHSLPTSLAVDVSERDLITRRDAS
jgi:hypothetical protein